MKRRSKLKQRDLDRFRRLRVFRDAVLFDASAADEDEQDDVPALAGAGAGEAGGDKEKKDGKKAADPAHSVPGTLTEQLKVNSGKGETKKFNLPIPETQKSSTFDKVVPSTFRPSHAYIRHRINYNDDYSFTGDVEYELTHEDEEWLQSSKKYGPKGDFPFSEDLMEKAIDVMERRTGRDVPIEQSEAVALCKRQLDFEPVKENKVLDDLYNYWKRKRQRLGKPLLRRFWPITAPLDNNPNLTFRPRVENQRRGRRNKRKNDIDSYEKMVALRSDFEMMKSLLELVRRREHLREVEAKLLEDEFEQHLFDLSCGGKDTRESLAPLVIPPGPLDQDQVDQVFESNRTPQNKQASPAPGTLSRIVSEATSVDLAVLEVEPDKKKKKKKRKKSEGVIAVPPPTAPAPAATPGTGTGVSSTSSGDTAAPAVVMPAVPPKPLRPPDFLLDSGNPPYMAAELETMLPQVPTWPPSHFDMRRKHHEHAILHQDQLHHHAQMQSSAAQAKGLAHAQCSEAGQEERKDGKADDAHATAGKQAKKDGPHAKVNGEDSQRIKEDKSLGSELHMVGDPTSIRGAFSSAYQAPVHHHKFVSRKEAPPRFRFRPRIGRGGRVIVDRIPVQAHSVPSTMRRYTPREVFAGPDPFETRQDFLDPCKPRHEISPDLTLPVNVPALSATQLNKIQAIYLQEDSDDEDVTVLDYPYLAPLCLEPEEEARLRLATHTPGKGRSASNTVHETKFRFLV